MVSPTAVERLRRGDHACWLYDNEPQGLTVVARYVQVGLDGGEKVLLLTDSVRPEALLAGLDAHGVDGDGCARSGQLEIVTADDAYLATRGFDPETMIASWTGTIGAARDGGWAGLRVAADMSWALRPTVDASRLAWYEAHVNSVFSDDYTTVVCQYDRRRFPASELRRVAAAHPATMPVGADGDWEPLLHLTRMTDQPGLRLSGEADVSNHEAIAATLYDTIVATAHTGREFVVDVTELRFADAATADLLVTAARACPAGLAVVGCSRTLAQMMAWATEMDHFGAEAGTSGLRVVVRRQAS
ncbi:hypothetical protein HC028_18420 [Planosporangium flavigriseum]|uniref:STAS domain-containing protein n=1 Tax=Planosporangium flavigriseum TaxID=373681 RepID=A0A8J3PP79_9ACTN|nr:MEDS domain-containing protein [Planosporangium flavigriseum]NJC66464.1 hypothetical protein [Planosporangium flavigriseum]GIG76772.1 hypothetical protein Pfl04_51760 [Planosporangium flavigriseum]